MADAVLLISTCRTVGTALGRVLREELGIACDCCSPDHIVSIKREPALPRASVRLCLCDQLGCTIQGMEAVLRSCIRLMPCAACAVYNAPLASDVEKLLSTLGVRAVFYQDDDLQVFIEGVRHILAEGCLHGSTPGEEGARAAGCHATGPGFGRSDGAQLTAREEEALRMIACGKNNAAIAAALQISESTVKTHIYNAFKKIGVPNRTQAALWAFTNLQRK